jgi:hypothetical protein
VNWFTLPKVYVVLSEQHFSCYSGRDYRKSIRVKLGDHLDILFGEPACCFCDTRHHIVGHEYIQVSTMTVASLEAYP